jgi:hypothetical protein
LENVTLCLEKGAENHTVSACVLSSPVETVSYIDFSVARQKQQEKLLEYAKNSHVLLLSSAGERYAEGALDGGRTEKIFWDEEPQYMPIRIRCEKIPCYIYRDSKRNRMFLLTEG